MLLHARTVENSLPDKPMRFVTRGTPVSHSTGFERASFEGNAKDRRRTRPSKPSPAGPYRIEEDALLSDNPPGSLTRGKDKSLQ